jgi:surface polysaccharide O-acyltransferase-like enzyme
MSNIEVIQLGLGAAELGMTRMNIIEVQRSYSGTYWSSLETYITLIFAYVVAMFIAGNKLRRKQYIVLTSTYSLISLFVLLVILSYVSLAIKWQNYSGLSYVLADYPATSILIVAMTLFSMLVISIWFGWSIRNPKVSGSAPVD